MAWTTQDLANIEHALAQGAQTVQFQDRTVTYRSIEDLLKARDVIRQSLSTAPRTAVGAGDKGL